MKKYIAFLSLGILLHACQTPKKTKNTNDLQIQKKQIETQIDSLTKILVDIDKKLNLNSASSVPAIRAMLVNYQSFTHYIDIQGSINTDGNVLVVPEVLSTVKNIYKKEGDLVYKGQIILVLDDEVLRNQIDEVKIQYDLAKTAYDRQKKLWDQKIGSEMTYLEAKTKKEGLARKLSTLRAQLDKFFVKSPINGTLDDLMIKVGEMAGPQKPVARIVNLNQVYMQADVSEKYLPTIKKGTPVRIAFSEIGKNINAKVTYVGNFIQPNNRTFKIRVNLKNADNLLKPNLTGNIKIQDYYVDKAIVLPLSLIQEDREGRSFVFVLSPVSNQNEVYQVVKRLVNLGKTYQDQAMVVGGLKAGEIITTLAGRGLTAGDKVYIQNLNEILKQQQSISNASKLPAYHTVKKTESLKSLSQKYHVSVSQLKKWNHLTGSAIKTGDKIIVNQ